MKSNWPYSRRKDLSIFSDEKNLKILNSNREPTYDEYLNLRFKFMIMNFQSKIFNFSEQYNSINEQISLMEETFDSVK